MTPVHLALGLVTGVAALYGLRYRRAGRSAAPDTPISELIEALTEQLGQPVRYSVETLDDGTQVLLLPADDPLGAASQAQALPLPLLRVVADLDAGQVQLYPHPDSLTGLATLYTLTAGELVDVPTATAGGEPVLWGWL